MKTYYELLLEKSKQVRGKIEDIKNDVYWLNDAIDQIIGTLGQILILSGFLENSEYDKKISDLFKDAKNNKESLESLLEIVEEMIKKPSVEWKKAEEKIEPIAIVYKMKDALEDIKNAIIIAKESDNLSQEQIKRIKGTDSPGAKAFNKYLNNSMGKVNGFISILSGNKGIESYKSREEGLYVQYTSLTNRINNLLYVITPMGEIKGINKDQYKVLNDTITRIDAVQGKIKERMHNLKEGNKIDTREYQKTFEKQNEEFNHLKDDFFDSFKELIVVDGRGKRVNELISSAGAHLLEIDELIEETEEARKMFKGVDRDSDLYKSLEKFDIAAEHAKKKAIEAVQIRKGYKESKEEIKGKESNLNTKTIEIDDQLRSIFNQKVETGKIKADLKKLEDYLGKNR